MTAFRRFRLLRLLIAASLGFSWLAPFAAADDVPAPAKSRREKWKEYLNGPRRDREPLTEDEAIPQNLVDYIDIPTTNVIDYGSFRLNFRLYSQGGVQNHISFGVFRRLNIGATWDVEKLLGTEDADTHVPTLNVKFRVYDGSEVLPSMAIGYDGQGRFYDKSKDEYRERERGLYGVIGRELFFPHWEFYGGPAIAKFKEGEVTGFLGTSYLIEDKVAIMLEYDNIRTAPDNRLNAGIRIFPIPALAIDFDVRHLAEKDQRERIVRINFVGSF